MRSHIFLVALTGAVAALPKPGPTGPGLDLSDWTVRADWSRCANAAASEVVVQGQIVATAVSAGTGIADFQLPVSFDGSIVIKPKGAVGFGATYPPSRIELNILDAQAANGTWATATYTPGISSATGNKLAQVAWFTQPDQAFSPASSIDYTALQGTEAVAIETTVSPSYLRVYYCGAPDPVKP